MESNGARCFVNFINKHPIALNMTFERVFPFALKRVVTAFRWQGLFVDDHLHNFTKFINMPAAFFRQLEFFSKRLWVNRLKHRLIVRVVPHKVFPHFLKSIKTAQCGRYLAPHHGPAFLNGGDSFGIGHIVVCGANRAFALIVKPVIVKLFPGIRRGGFRNSIGGPLVRRRLVCGFYNAHGKSIA